MFFPLHLLDIRCLPIEINGIIGFDLQPFRSSLTQPSQFRPNINQSCQPVTGIGQ